MQFTIALKVLVAVLTVPTGTINLDQIDMTDWEWVAPGYEVITELDFDPLEYVDNVQAAQAFFMDTEDGEKLRLILVGDNRVLVFDEPWETYMEYPVEPPWEIRTVTFSRNGNFIALNTKKDTTITSGFMEWQEIFLQGFRLEIAEICVLSDRFDANPGGYAYYCYMSNNGRITGSNERGVISLYPQGDVEEFLSREPSPIMWQRQGCSYDGSLIALGNIPLENGNIGIQGYDWSGNLLWETPIGDRNLTNLRVTPSGEYVLAPARNGGMVCYSGGDGSKFWEIAEGLVCSYPQISPNGEHWIIAPAEIGHSYFYSGSLNKNIDDGLISASEIISSTFERAVCLNVSNHGQSLFWTYSSDNDREQRLLYLNHNHIIQWISGIIDSSPLNLRFSFFNAKNTSDYFRGTIAAISEDGSRICYTDYQSIKVLHFEEVQ